MPEAQATGGYCTRKPTPGSYLSDTCPDCGHLLAVHVGTHHCPVCEMVDLNRQLAEIVKGGPHEALMRAGLLAGAPYRNVRR